MQARLSFLILFFSALLLSASPALSKGGSEPSDEGVSPRCEAAIDKAAGNYSRCLLKASAKYAKSKKKNEDRLFAQQAKCDDQWDAQVARAQGYFGEERCTPYVSELADRTVTYAEGAATEASGTPAPSYLFVQNGSGGALSETTLTLTEVSDKIGWFTDRPYREAGQLPIEEFLSHWWGGENSFADDPPNADFTCTVNGEVVNHVVELTMPLLVGDELTYTVQGIGDRDLPTDATCDQTASLFIDDEDASMECLKKMVKKYGPLRDLPDSQRDEYDRAYFVCYPCKHGSSLARYPDAKICTDRVTVCQTDSDCPTGGTCYVWLHSGLACECPDGGLPGFGDTADCGGPGEIH